MQTKHRAYTYRRIDMQGKYMLCSRISGFLLLFSPVCLQTVVSSQSKSNFDVFGCFQAAALTFQLSGNGLSTLETLCGNLTWSVRSQSASHVLYLPLSSLVSVCFGPG